MNQPGQKLCRMLDRLTERSANFALYRLPWTDNPTLVLQENNTTTILNGLNELNGRYGFVIAPFQKTKTHPVVLIRPDKIIQGWENIEKALSTIPKNETISDKQPVFHEETTGHNKNDYQNAFKRFIVPLQEKRFQKLVLSRCSRQPLPNNFSPTAAFIRACNSYPRMMISLCHTPITGTWIGSSPEIILSGKGEKWHTVALAGTMPIEDEINLPEWNVKNQEEQAYVCRYLRDIIHAFDSDFTEEGPYTVRAGQVVHLKTDFYFRLSDTRKLGNLLKELHPTPAVCGLPKQETFDFILQNEGYDREYYSGIIGWINPDDETNLYVNLRCMRIKDKQILLFAGGGILASSNVNTEWEETVHKINTMQNIL